VSVTTEPQEDVVVVRVALLEARTGLVRMKAVIVMRVASNFTIVIDGAGDDLKIGFVTSMRDSKTE